MGWRLVEQPNKLIARFSDVVDNFTHCNLTHDEAIKVCIEEYGLHQIQAKEKLSNAIKNPHRFEESLSIIEAIHGKAERDSFASEASILN